MEALIQREILAARYRKLVKIGDRAGAKEVHEQLRRIVAQILRGDQ